MTGCPGDTRLVSRQQGSFSVRFSIVNNRKCLGHRPVDPYLSRRVSQGHPTGVPRIFFILCAFFFPESKGYCSLRGWRRCGLSTGSKGSQSQCQDLNIQAINPSSGPSEKLSRGMWTRGSARGGAGEEVHPGMPCHWIFKLQKSLLVDLSRQGYGCQTSWSRSDGDPRFQRHCCNPSWTILVALCIDHLAKPQVLWKTRKIREGRSNALIVRFQCRPLWRIHKVLLLA